MRWLPALLAAAALAGCGATEERAAAPPTSFQSPEHRFSVELPAGWRRADHTLTPRLTDPVEILSAGTGPLPQSPEPESCAHVAVGALEAMGAADAFVTIQERLGEGDFPSRPERFALARRVEHGAATCARGEQALEEHWLPFEDAGRRFYALVALGPEASEARRAEALALLDSLRFEPPVFEDPAAGLRWQMPTPPWRRYEQPLTRVQGERLLLGTFPVEDGPPDDNCTPRAALDALPADGAFIYLFEYVDLAERWQRRIPERPAELTLGPEIAYECMGVSRMATWQEQGRAFQAHVYFGARASERTRREALAILNSIRAR